MAWILFDQSIYSWKICQQIFIGIIGKFDFHHSEVNGKNTVLVIRIYEIELSFCR